MKKIVMVIAYKDFQDIEYFIPRNIFLRAGLKVETVSSRAGIALSSGGDQVKVHKGLKDLDISQLEAIVFCGGQGAIKYLDNDISYKILEEAERLNKIIGAICISPIILAKAGILKSKKATVWSTPIQRKAIKILETEGAIYSDKPVVVDGNIVTASGPRAAKEFAETIVEKLNREK